jgi:hypothetical protein
LHDFKLSDHTIAAIPFTFPCRVWPKTEAMYKDGIAAFKKFDISDASVCDVGMYA